MKLVTIVATLCICCVWSQDETLSGLNAYSQEKIKRIFAELSFNDSTSALSDRVETISRELLGTPYKAHALVGSARLKEKLIADLRGLDCFTYLDYVEAIRMSHSEHQFLANLKRVRYADGQVSFVNRKHFFTDWAYRAEQLAHDITQTISNQAITVTKMLNRKKKGGVYLRGLKVVERTVSYIPRKAVSQALPQLRTGDLIGIYSPKAGLDVSHVGIFIAGDTPMFRHASSRRGRVVDEPFLGYLKNKKGIIVLRLKSSSAF